MANTGFVNGSDLILSIDGSAVGHCTSHSIDFSTETKDRAYKPLASEAASAGLWTSKGVTGKSVSINFDGLMVYDETETSFDALLTAYENAKEPCVVEVTSYVRGNTTKPFITGKFVLTKLSLSAGASDDATYSGTLENYGAPTIASTIGSSAS